MPLRTIDCTLRDGGNLNGWQFRRDHVDRIIRGLVAELPMLRCSLGSGADVAKLATDFGRAVKT